MHAYEVLRPAMRLWYGAQLRDGMGAPTPRDEPASRSGRSDADRVLLLGNGPTHGWGVLSHHFALTGRLAEAMTNVTGRPCDVEYVGDELMNVASAVSWLGARDVAAYDLVIVVVGMNDAVRLTPVDAWSSALRSLIDQLLTRARADVHVLLAGIQPVRSVAPYAGLYSLIGQLHADRLNAAARRVLTDIERAEHVDLHAPAFEPGRPLGSAKPYGEWAERLALRAAPLVRHGADASAAPSEAWVWEGAGRIIAEQRDGGELLELRALEDAARIEFGADIALVTLLDGDRQWFPTARGPLPSSVPRELTYCDVAARQEETLVVPDSRRDDRFRGNPYIDQSGTPFYAGKALKSPDGAVIGSLCVLNASPRAASSIDLSRFDTFATEAEALLQRLGAGTDAPDRPREAVPAP